MNNIFHITQRQQWAAAKKSNIYQSDSLDTEGFIHCSTAAQVVGSANRFFSNQQDLVILAIDVDRVTAEIRYEGADEGNLFPHIYGGLNIDAVIWTIDFEADADGVFRLPSEIIDLT
jgi:uncharacterized protein (DUF952 family)